MKFLTVLATLILFSSASFSMEVQEHQSNAKPEKLDSLSQDKQHNEKTKSTKNEQPKLESSDEKNTEEYAPIPSGGW